MYFIEMPKVIFPLSKTGSLIRFYKPLVLDSLLRNLDQDEAPLRQRQSTFKIAVMHATLQYKLTGHVP